MNIKTISKTILAAAAAVLCACNIDGVVEQEVPAAPVITLESESYSLKVGREVTISPQYAYNEGADYCWSLDGLVVGREPSYRFEADTAGRFFLKIEVSTSVGRDSREIRMDVAELALPYITLPDAARGFGLIAGEELELVPVISDTGLETALEWQVRLPEADDFETVSTADSYTFSFSECGTYLMRLTASNEDGSCTLDFSVTVALPEDAVFGWEFRQTKYVFSSGRRVKIAPCVIRNPFDAEYVWSVDGEEVQRGSEPAFICDVQAEGLHEVVVTMRNAYTEASRRLEVEVCPPEGTYMRAKSAASSPRWSRVYEFTPAPGQYINENYTALTPDEACAYAESRLETGKRYVSLGAFGGYIVVGFDHSIVNTGGYDFAISGNSFDTSSEPGIVWVMQDENGNGLPDDTWYELAGSESGSADTVYDYAVTYYRPSGSGMDVPWVDNRGNSGTVDYQKAFHRQDTYYPAWIAEESYTLYGTCLKARNYMSSDNNWVQPPYEWGYADNFSSIDRLSSDSNAEAGVNPNHFKISDAVDFEGKPIKLEYIDFIKVQTGVNAKSGWLGELSTEVCDFYEYTAE